MPPSHYVAQPEHVTAEAYVAASEPPQTGVCTCDLHPHGGPHVHGKVTAYALTEGDWIITHLDGTTTVLSDALFQQRFKPGGP